MFLSSFHRMKKKFLAVRKDGQQFQTTKGNSLWICVDGKTQLRPSWKQTFLVQKARCKHVYMPFSAKHSEPFVSSTTGLTGKEDSHLLKN